MSGADDRDSHRVARLVERVLEARERGDDVDLAAMCNGDPTLQLQLEQAIENLDRLPEMYRWAGGRDDHLGTTLSERYRIVERIGAGAMGVVFRAHDRELGRDVAIKLLRDELLGGEQMVARFAREAEVLASIRNGNVITVHDRGRTDDSRVFLVMELLQGVSLGEWSPPAADTRPPAHRLAEFRTRIASSDAQESSDLRQIARWLSQVCAGLQAAHEAGVVHRDIKPSNLFVEADGRVVVLDFGIGSLSSHATVGASGSPLGTPAYMAPEQVRGAEPDARTDVYGIAATLYHLISGRPPFSGTIQKVLREVDRGDPPRIDVVRPGIPRDLAAIVEKGMAREPAARYASAAALRADLGAWLAHRPVTARRVSVWRRGARRALRSPAFRTAGVVMVLAALSAAGWSWWQDHVEQVRQSSLAAFERVGASVVNDLPAARPTNTICHSESQTRALDEMVELGAHPGLAHALRSLHRLDAGDLDGAADDTESIAAGGDAPFAEKVASLLRDGRTDVGELMRDGAPKTGDADDRLLCVAHALRLGTWSEAWVEKLATQEGDATRPGLEDLRVLLDFLQSFSIQDATEKIAALRAVLVEARVIELRRGTTSGSLLHARANALMLLGRNAEAAATAEAALERNRDDFLYWLAAGSALFHLQQNESAAALLTRARELQPSSLTTVEALVETMIRLERFDDAIAVIEQAPWWLSGRGASRRRVLEAKLLYGRAWFRRREERATGDSTDASQALYKQAREAFRQAGANDGEARFEEAVSALQIGADVSCAQLFALMRAKPVDPNVLHQMADVLPDELDASEVDALRSLLVEQARALDGRDR